MLPREGQKPAGLTHAKEWDGQDRAIAEPPRQLLADRVFVVRDQREVRDVYGSPLTHRTGSNQSVRQARSDELVVIDDADTFAAGCPRVPDGAADVVGDVAANNLPIQTEEIEVVGCAE